MEGQEICLEQRIIKASIEMFISRGIRDVSMDEVAKNVGISKRTLYEVFSSKDDLLYKSVEYMQAERNKMYENLIASAENIIDMAFLMMEDCLKISKIVSPAFWEDLCRANYRSIVASLDRNQEERRLSIVRLLNQGKEIGLIRKDVDAELFSVLITSRNNDAMRDLFNDAQWSFSYLILHISAVFLRGISTAEGQEMIDRRLNELEEKIKSVDA